MRVRVCNQTMVRSHFGEPEAAVFIPSSVGGVAYQRIATTMTARIETLIP